MLEQVVDASVALKWVFQNEDYRKQARALATAARDQGIRMIAPPLFESETESAIQECVFDGTLSETEANEMARFLSSIGVQIVHEAPVKEVARRIGRRFNQRRLYDATYAALAEVRGCDLWTADKAFYDAVHTGLPFVRFIRDFRAPKE
jgi:predicted nucleic acid-binding protein